MIMQFVKTNGDKITVELDMNTASTLAEALSDAVSVQKYNYKIDDISELSRDINSIIVQAAQELAREMQSRIDVAEYRTQQTYNAAATQKQSVA